MTARRTATPDAAAALLLAAAGVWPLLVASVRHLVETPYQRALHASFCGDAHAGALFAVHCAACPIGVATLTAAALIAAFQRRRVALAVRS